MKKLNRYDNQYTDIENFKDYELTNCIAYEMAIRNNQVMQLIRNDLLFKKENNSLSCSTSTSLLLKNFYINEYYLAYHFFEDIVNIKKERMMAGWNWGAFRNRNHLENDGKRIFNCFEEEGFTTIITVIDSAVPEQSIIIPATKRPKLETYPIIKEFDIKLNLSLPEKDLISYIKNIKSSFDQSYSLFPSGFEVENGLLLENSEKISSRDILTNKEKVADMFFIYDCYELNIKPLKIRYELEDYYSTHKNINTKSFTEKTIKKYFDIAKEYIDNRRYKELVTGLKLENLEEHEEW